jgi:hypothetical protein
MLGQKVKLFLMFQTIDLQNLANIGDGKFTDSNFKFG